MEKYRISFTVQDYYNYVGTNPCCSTKEHMLQSIPDLFKKNGYNIKFKKVHYELRPWSTWYRVHMSVRICEKDIKQVLDWYKNASYRLHNVSYKLITKHF